MINNLILSIKLLKFLPSKKSNITGAVIFFAIGILYLFVMPSGGDMVVPICGTYFLAMPTLMLYQILPTESYTVLIGATEKAKHLVTDTFALVEWLFSTVTFLIEFIFINISVATGHLSKNDCGYLTLCLGIILSVFMIYSAACFKKFLVSSIVFALVAGVIFVFLGAKRELIVFANISAVPALVLGICAIALAGVLSFLVTKALYKYPIDKNSVGNRLKSEM